MKQPLLATLVLFVLTFLFQNATCVVPGVGGGGQNLGAAVGNSANGTSGSVSTSGSSEPNVSPPSLLNVSILPSSFVASGASAQIQVSGGLPPYLYNFFGGCSFGQLVGTTFTNTSQTTHSQNCTVMISDQSKQVTYRALTVQGEAPSLLLLSASASSILTGQTVLLTVSGGTPPYSFAVVNGGGGYGTLNTTAPIYPDSTGVATALYIAPSSGTFTAQIQVSDSSQSLGGGDQTETAFAEIAVAPPKPPQPTLTANFQNISPGNTMELIASGGTPPYQFAITSAGSNQGTLKTPVALTGTRGGYPAPSPAAYSVLYVAPSPVSAAQTVQFTVTDSLSQIATAQVNVGNFVPSYQTYYYSAQVCIKSDLIISYSNPYGYYGNSDTVKVWEEGYDVSYDPAHLGQFVAPQFVFFGAGPNPSPATAGVIGAIGEGCDPNNQVYPIYNAVTIQGFSNTTHYNNAFLSTLQISNSGTGDWVNIQVCTFPEDTTRGFVLVQNGSTSFTGKYTSSDFFESSQNILPYSTIFRSLYYPPNYQGKLSGGATMVDLLGFQYGKYKNELYIGISSAYVPQTECDQLPAFKNVFNHQLNTAFPIEVDSI